VRRNLGSAKKLAEPGILISEHVSWIPPHKRMLKICKSFTKSLQKTLKALRIYVQTSHILTRMSDGCVMTFTCREEQRRFIKAYHSAYSGLKLIF
jgi:Leu/Phe-tRNA-protein transferase